MRIVVALGGNAFLERGQAPESEIQQEHVVDAVRALAPLAAEHQLLITHGNGPQVGVLAAESAHDPSLSRPYPFDVLGAQTQGMIGYWLVQALHDALPDRRAACLLSRTVVRADDPAFAEPTKFVGPVYDAATASHLSRDRGWVMRRDGPRWRRVVASPEPVSLVELPTVHTLMDAGVLVVCAGGGGIPVSEVDGRLSGREAVIDKDLTAALLAVELRAQALLVLTDVDAIQDDFGTPRARPVRRATPGQLRARSFPAGSMGPKVDAVCRFVEATGARAAIGRLDDARELLAGTAGTVVSP